MNHKFSTGLIDLPDNLYTYLEYYNLRIAEENARHQQELELIESELRECQNHCDHTFGEKHQIGWVPDVEIMGYSCKTCGYQIRERDLKKNRIWTEWLLGEKK